jgi:hypothetical protein
LKESSIVLWGKLDSGKRNTQPSGTVWSKKQVVDRMRRECNDDLHCWTVYFFAGQTVAIQCLYQNQIQVECEK